MIAAGTTQFTTDGTNRSKNSKNDSLPFCHTISVVMSPNGLNAPPALAATTTETQVNSHEFRVVTTQAPAPPPP